MKNSLYLECASGISGDMTVAALIDLGADKELLQKALDSIPLDFKTEITRVKKNGIDCCDFNVILEEENHDHDMEYLFGHEHNHEHTHDHHHEHSHEHDHSHEHTHDHEHHHHSHRGMAEITQIINATSMSEDARTLALKIFSIIAESESKAHGIPVEQVHFHEVGAVDSIVDVISMAVCFDSLGIDKVYVPRMFEGSGTIRCQHGILPVPVPAVMNIAQQYSLPLQLSNEKGEFITPTGAAFVAAVKTDLKLPIGLTIKKTGLGAGKRTYERPSILRAMLIQENTDDTINTTDSIIKIETNIDDCSGENLGFVMEELFKAGAKDVFYMPCFMKKNRPAWVLNVICTEEACPVMEQIIFKQTTTIGLRKFQANRAILERECIDVQTEWGCAKVKRVKIGDQERYYPEYESVASIAKSNNLSFMEVYNKLSRS